MKCYHCGDTCTPSTTITYKDYPFCCYGCRTVYEILECNRLEGYYQLENFPGLKTESSNQEQYAFLDQEDIKQRWVLFENEKITKITFHIPQIHCSACIWLLENLHRLNGQILSSIVNFSNRRVDITFSNKELTLRQVVELLSSIGYEPNLHENKQEEESPTQKSIYYKIGVAGFCFGNIMLLSFPEYLGIDSSYEGFRSFFGYISLTLSIPVFFYSGMDYLKNAIRGIQQQFINMDIPIALGMITLFIRSTYEVITVTGSGYFDSLSGLVFFLLLGKWFQKKIYNTLSFERDYKSYFPIAVYKYDGKQYTPTKIENLRVGDHIELRNNELIPADGVLLSGEAFIDYSFVTGESDLVRKKEGDQIYAGGRQTGTKIYVELQKKVSNSYLTQLWNQDVFRKQDQSTNLNSISNKVSKYFTIVVLGITLGAALFWWKIDASVMWNALTAVLIVACPCALALSVPFTLGNTMRLMGHKGFYLKNAEIIEKISNISTIVLDKTGTITHRGIKSIDYHGTPLTENEKKAVKSIVSNSVHPLSIAIKGFIEELSVNQPTNFEEVTGQGIVGVINDLTIKVGSASFLDIVEKEATNGVSKVFLSINDSYKGYFQLKQRYRKGLKKVIAVLKGHFSLQLLTGDNDGQKQYLIEKLGIEKLYFNQSPIDKLNYVKEMQARGERVLMLGDGLNDAGALKQSYVGIAVSDNIHQFSPACDAILNANQFERFPYFVKLSKKSILIIKMSFVISFFYNAIGLLFAITGQLSPIVAAILMPLSSVTIVLFSTLATNYVASKIKN